MLKSEYFNEEEYLYWILKIKAENPHLAQEDIHNQKVKVYHHKRNKATDDIFDKRIWCIIKAYNELVKSTWYF